MLIWYERSSLLEFHAVLSAFLYGIIDQILHDHNLPS
jgi:hypothetical protein